MIELVQTTRICKSYPSGESVVNAVNNVSISIREGEYLAVCGRSGSGKSTLMSLLGLLESPDSGEYRLNGRDVANLNQNQRAAIRNKQIGFVFQVPALLPRASALENVALPLLYADVTEFDRRQRAKDALERVGLAHRGHHRPNQLSGGEQQRVVIARAIVCDPTLILADEPTGALDTSTSEEILSIFEELHREGRTIVVVTHAPEVANRATRHIIVGDGRIMTDNPLADYARTPFVSGWKE